MSIGAHSSMTISTPAKTAAPQVAVNDIGTAEDFLAAVAATIKYFNDGDIVEGTIVKVDRDEVLLDIGYKTEGVIPSVNFLFVTMQTPTRSSPLVTPLRPLSSRRKTKKVV